MQRFCQMVLFVLSQTITELVSLFNSSFNFRRKLGLTRWSYMRNIVLIVLWTSVDKTCELVRCKNIDT